MTLEELRQLEPGDMVLDHVGAEWEVLHFGRVENYRWRRSSRERATGVYVQMYDPLPDPDAYDWVLGYASIPQLSSTVEADNLGQAIGKARREYGVPRGGHRADNWGTGYITWNDGSSLSVREA